MRNINSIEFVRNGLDVKAVVRYDDSKKVTVSNRFGQCILRDYVEKNNIKDYRELVSKKFVISSIYDPETGQYDSLFDEDIAKRIINQSKANPGQKEEITHIHLGTRNVEGEDRAFLTVSYLYTFGDKKTKNVNERYELNDSDQAEFAEEEIIRFGLDNKAKSLKELIADEKFSYSYEMKDFVEGSFVTEVDKVLNERRGQEASSDEDAFEDKEDEFADDSIISDDEVVDEDISGSESETESDSEDEDIDEDEDEAVADVEARVIDEDEENESTDEIEIDINEVDRIDFIIENGKRLAVVFCGNKTNKMDIASVNKIVSEIISKRGVEVLKEKHFINYFIIEDEYGYEITKEQYFNNTKIGNIAIYKTTENGKDVCKGVVFCTDGTVKELSNEEEISKMMLTYMRANNIKDPNFIFDKGIVITTTEEELEEKFEQFRRAASINLGPRKKPKKTEEENKKGIIAKIVEKLKSSKLARRITLGVTAFAVLLGGFGAFKLVRNSKTGKMTGTDKVAESTEENTEDLEEVVAREDFSSYSCEQLIKKCQNNKDRKQAMKAYYKFLTNYNNKVANSYLEQNNNAKTMHFVEEVDAMYLLFNDLSSEEIFNIYGGTKLDKEELINNFGTATFQAALAHNIQTDTLGKTRILKSDEAKEFYRKYEEIFINMNKTSDANEKAHYAEQFYAIAREDLPGMSHNDYARIPDYKVLIKEFVEAINNTNIDVANKFTNDELNYINTFVTEKVNNKFESIANKQLEQIEEASIDYGTGSALDNDLNPYFSEFKDQLVEELTAAKGYVTDGISRGIDSYNSYSKNTNINVEKTDEVVEEVKEVKNTEPVQTKVSSSQPVTEEAAPTVSEEVNESEPIIINGVINDQECDFDDEYIENEKKQKLRRKKKKHKLSRIEDKESLDSIGEVFSKDPDLVDISKVPDHLPEFDIDTGVDEITPDEVTDEIDTPTDVPSDNPTENPSDNGDTTIDVVEPGDNFEVIEPDQNITIDEDKQDENGNLSDQFTDLTTNPDGASEWVLEEADSNEAIVDEIISQMEQGEYYFEEEVSEKVR